ncbi:hypothetical protein L226DRAFT_278212 [Lentinus tigrinus ALCF2SS1-7]|uniref:Secreted protein n=1 Tax=Lentinus tigrinus ALCF2SS1-6 TaxID=1328759 RepID=A0A5C2RT34_9APHY|nr:hypothetical protein L227DRAFT_353465 [Lentinus tigrinus ALCF2SS1-6]RPD69243.1 hypothetical protein L226DRAFT_278212 [Lentinus tigrinus ALCF2SS1-7]
MHWMNDMQRHLSLSIMLAVLGLKRADIPVHSRLRGLRVRLSASSFPHFTLSSSSRYPQQAPTPFLMNRRAYYTPCSSYHWSHTRGTALSPLAVCDRNASPRIASREAYTTRLWTSGILRQQPTVLGFVTAKGSACGPARRSVDQPMRSTVCCRGSVYYFS